MRIINTINGFYDLNHIQGKRMARNLYYYLFKDDSLCEKESLEVS